MSNLLTKRNFYKPFKYEWAFEAYHTQMKILWLPEEVPLADDVKDWNTKLTKEEKNLITQIFRFFVQADVDIASGYFEKFIPLFKQPEVRMMLGAFACTESIHIHAYSLLLDTIGMPETEYKAFMQYQAMKEKHEYLENTFAYDGTSSDPTKESLSKTAKALAIYSAFGEGVQLFASFAILLNFTRFNKLKGMGQVVTWSIRDESLHCESMIKLFHSFIDENKHIWKSELKAEIYQACRDMIKTEDEFIELAFEQGGIEGLTKDEIKQYIRYIADRRLLQLGLKPEYKVKTNPLPWLDWVLNGTEHANFFEARSTEYSKGSLTGNWSDVWEKYDVPNDMQNRQSQTRTD